MNRYKQLMIVGYFILSIICFTACGIKKQDSSSNSFHNETTESDNTKTNESENDDLSENQKTNHLSMDVTNNMKIDADIENEGISQCMIYQTSYKQFDVNNLKELFFSENEDLNISENGATKIIESKSGAQLMSGDSDITYTSSGSMWDLNAFIQESHYPELDYGISHEQELVTMEQEPIIQNIVKILYDLCELGEGEELSLEAGVKVDADEILERQEKQKEKLEKDGSYQKSVESGFIEELDKEWHPNECYYLSFAVKKNNIPLIDLNEPSIAYRSENRFTKKTYLEVIVDENRIQLLNIVGIFGLQKTTEAKIMSVQDAALFLKQKYDLEIITNDRVVNKIWLEYLFVNDASSENPDAGTLQPYWCFQIKVTGEDEDGEYTSYMADRFNAVTGDDIEYE